MKSITPTALDSRVSVMQAGEDGGEVETSKGFVVDFFEGLLVGEKEKAEDWVDRGLKKQQVTGKKTVQ